MASKCRYFTSLSELLCWDEMQDRNQKARATLRTRYRKPDEHLHSRLLICHDFKGGYCENQDDLVEGYFPHPTGNAYWARAFSLTDTFVYFSHHRVTVPPISWTNACHKSGVSCLGTLIFEPSASGNTDLRDLIDRRKGYMFEYADVLTRIAQRYGFDGYLINVETILSTRDEAQLVLQFVDYLRYVMRSVLGNSSKVLWYDALTLENRVDYQDCLNSTTLPFFRAADGLFTNYFWTTNNVFSGAKLAGDQFKLDLWTGLDVWGRNTLYPAKFDIGKAIRQIEPAGTSLALFAPAWVYEDLPENEFEKNDFSFWFSNVDSESGLNNSISEFIDPIPAPVLSIGSYKLFYTSFSTGHGTKFFVNGKPEFEQNWVFHSVQTALPSYMHGSKSPTLTDYLHKLDLTHISTAKRSTFSVTFRLDYSKAFYGGSSLKVTSNPRNLSPYYSIFNSTSTSPPPSNTRHASFQKSRRSSKNTTLAKPLFCLDMEIPTGRAFNFYVTFLKCSDGDVSIRISGYQDDQDKTPIEYSADLSGSVLNSWVRKSFTFPGPESLSGCNNYIIDHIDILCGYNFESSIYLGSMLLSSVEDSSKVNSGSLVSGPAPTRVTTVTHNLRNNCLDWPEDEETAEWIIYVNGKMVGVAPTPSYSLSSFQSLAVDESIDDESSISDYVLRVRIDSISWAGSIVKGTDTVLDLS
ncbi:glycosyl hydrolase family 85-domain-containing protein [Dipodascopsis uninucleata]